MIWINWSIVSSKGFEGFNCCVCFYIENNKNWIFVNDFNDSSFYGTTQKCLTNDSNVSQFSTPFEIAIKLKNSLDFGPNLYLKVLSFDSRNRLISESYGLVEIPIQRGRHSAIVNTWKPFIGNRMARMKQFFIGCVPIVHNFHTDSTQLNVRLNELFLNDIKTFNLILDKNSQ